MSNFKKIGVELIEGKTYKFELPKRLHTLDPSKLEEACEVITAAEYRKERGKFGDTISGTIVKVAKEGTADPTIWVEIPTAQRTKVKLVKLSGGEYGRKNVQEGDKIDNWKIVHKPQVAGQAQSATDVRPPSAGRGGR